jgi:predicted nucleotidyltransferase
VFETLRNVLDGCPAIGYALVFGSVARGTAHANSDLDIAIGGLRRPLAVLELGELIGRLESAAGRDVDLVLLDDAPVALAWRVFRDGKLILERDRDALADRKARAALEYFDWQPIEKLFADAGSNGEPRG